MADFLPAYTVDGPAAAPVLVLSGSLGSSAAMWDPQVRLLRQRFRVVRTEHRGHGGSPLPAQPGPWTVEDLAADLVRLLDHLEVERASWLGLSLGGIIGMHLAATRPERIDRLVLACTAAVIPPPEAWHERAALVRKEGGPAALGDVLLTRWFTGGFPERRPDVEKAVREMLAACDTEGYAGCCEAIAASDQRPLLPAITAPTLVISGAADPATPPADGFALHQAIPGSTFAVIPGAAHLANIEQPERFNAVLLDHLAGVPAERGRAARRKVMGDAYVERSEAGATDFTAPFIELITRYAWGEIWTRPGLTQQTRSCITMAILVALGRFEELPLHVRGALNNGLSREEIGEVLLQCAIYAGAPAAFSAFRVAQRTFDELDGAAPG